MKKSSPDPLKKLYIRENIGSPLQLPLTLLRERMRAVPKVLPQEAGPPPHLLHNIRKSLAICACRSCWLMASDAEKANMSFSSARFAERHGKGDPRGNVLARFLGYFFDVRQRSNTTAQRAALWRARPATEKISLSIQGVPP